MGIFFPVKYDEEHTKKWDEFRNDYETLAHKLEELLPQGQDRKCAYERLAESFFWMGRTLRASQCRCTQKKKEDDKRAKECSKIPTTEPAAAGAVVDSKPKRIIILKKT